MWVQHGQAPQSSGNVFGSGPSLKPEGGGAALGGDAGGGAALGGAALGGDAGAGASTGMPGSGGDAGAAGGLSGVVGHWANDAGGGPSLRSDGVPISLGGEAQPALKGAGGAWDLGGAWQSFSGPALSSIGDRFDPSVGAAVADAVQHKTPRDIAKDGFKGGGHEIPHRQAMESSFGMDFSSVRAHTDGKAQGANQALNSQAYAMGNQIAFKSASPEPALVAHELTHVLQQTGGGPARKSDGGGIDTSGEAQADAVESAVRAGKPARSVLGDTSLRAGVGPARKGLRPALSGGGFMEKFGMGMSFSKEKFEKSYSWKLIDAKVPEIPTPIPSIYGLVDLAATVKGAGGVEYGGKNDGNTFLQLGIEGSVGFGLGGGVPQVAMLYGMGEGKVGGSLQLNSQTEPEPGKEPGGWNLQGTITGEVGTKVGIRLGPNGIVDYAYELGKIELFKITGIYFDAGGFRKERLGFEWGDKIKAVFDEMNAIVEKAKNMDAAAWNKVKAAGNAIASAPGELWNKFKSFW